MTLRLASAILDRGCAAGAAAPEAMAVMDLARFSELVDRHGGDLAAWPDDVRAEAMAFLAAEPEARALLGDELALARALRAGAPVTAPAGLLDRILKRAFDTPGDGSDRTD